jgi:hypothetical protein
MFTSIIFASLICIRPLLTYLIPSCLINNDATETLPHPSTTQNSSRLSKRFSAIIPYKLGTEKRRSGHVMLEDEDVAGKDDGEESVGSSGGSGSGSGLGKGEVKVWITNERYVESCVVELGELARDRDDLTPNYKARTTIESTTTVEGKMLSRILEEEDLERG